MGEASVLIPAYDEADGITRTLTLLVDHLVRALPAYAWEVLVVDDGSTDATAERVRSFAASAPLPVRLLVHDTNRGLGAALRTGVTASRGEVVVTLDADLSYDLGHVGRLLDRWEDGRPDVVVASPYAPGGRTLAVPRGLELRSRLANRYLARVSGLPVHTYTGLVRAYDGAVVRSLAWTADGPAANVEILRLVKARGGTVVEVPATLDWTRLAARRGRSSLLSGRALRETRLVLREGAGFRGSPPG